MRVPSECTPQRRRVGAAVARRRPEGTGSDGPCNRLPCHINPRHRHARACAGRKACAGAQLVVPLGCASIKVRTAAGCTHVVPAANTVPCILRTRVLSIAHSCGNCLSLGKQVTSAALHGAAQATQTRLARCVSVRRARCPTLCRGDADPSLKAVYSAVNADRKANGKKKSMDLKAWGAVCSLDLLVLLHAFVLLLRKHAFARCAPVHVHLAPRGQDRTRGRRTSS